jgi:hypothetical protein
VHQFIGYFIGESLQCLLGVDILFQLRQSFFDRLPFYQFGAIAQLPNMVGGLVSF